MYFLDIKDIKKKTPRTFFHFFLYNRNLPFQLTLVKECFVTTAKNVILLATKEGKMLESATRIVRRFLPFFRYQRRFWSFLSVALVLPIILYFLNPPSCTGYILYHIFYNYILQCERKHE